MHWATQLDRSFEKTLPLSRFGWTSFWTKIYNVAPPTHQTTRVNDVNDVDDVNDVNDADNFDNVNDADNCFSIVRLQICRTDIYGVIKTGIPIELYLFNRVQFQIPRANFSLILV